MMRANTPLDAIKALLVAATVLFLHTDARARDCETELPCARPTAWSSAFNAIDLDVEGKAPGDYARWRMRMSSATHDFRIAVDQKLEGKRTQGELAMVAGRILITKDLKLPAGYEIDAVDAPLHMTQLAVQLLGHAIPEGPASFKGKRNVRLLDQRPGFRYATPSASSEYFAPWSVVGSVQRERTGRIRFDLRFSSDIGSDGKPGYTTRLRGALHNLDVETLLANDMRLDDWKVYGIGPLERKQGASTVLDYGATADNRGYRTVGDLRAEIERQQHPGTADPSKDFSGFWKSDCEQRFGLQIKPDGVPGRYAVNFCGPGACGTDGRHSFINGDRRYQVVSEDELKERDGDGWSTLRKCTRDPDDTPVERKQK